MRRRSERKKSTDVASPAPAAASVPRRFSRRSRKSPSFSEVDKNLDTNEPQSENEISEEQISNRASSEDRAETTRHGRSTRNRTPVKECITPAKRKNKREPSPESKIDAIPEEENGSTDMPEEEQSTASEELTRNENELKEMETVTSTKKDNVTSPATSPKNDVTDNNTSESQAEEPEDTVEANEIKSKSNEMKEQLSLGQEEKLNRNDDIPLESMPTGETAIDENSGKEDATGSNNEISNSHEKSAEQETPCDSQKHDERSADNGRTRKRRWLTKKCNEGKAPILAISTDSLKNLIADVHPVPLSDIQLDSSSEVEEVISEREEGEETPSPERERRPASIEKVEKTLKRSQSKNSVTAVPDHQNTTGSAPMHHSPSPAANQASNVLYITNLVRPFTILQLKGLLARTGKIVEDCFWIDRIKSKCYVQYETEDEAIETRHALHGVRWPVSNPKCLNVEFGDKTSMERAIQSTKDEGLKFGQDNSKDNLIVGTGWNRDRADIDVKKISRPVREWDVGKKESLDRDKNRELEKRRSRERETSENRENYKNDKDRKNRPRGRELRSNSLSPVRKLKKKENDPPLRLLDDLFRKTKATPCIYWLPLTPEQIAEKEAFRQKRIEEHKERIKQKELERGKEREKDRGRGNERDRDREHRRNRSSDRRRSRSRDRRRY